MRYAAKFVVVTLFVSVASPAPGALYYSGEPLADLPSQWPGFLLDQRILRNIALKPTGTLPASAARLQYLETANKYETIRRSRNLSPDELADLGAVYARLGDLTKAVEVLRIAQRTHPNHFRIAANLGTAWQLSGDLDQAAAALEQSARLAPGKWQHIEEAHLKLVRLRQREPRASGALDRLFEATYVGESGHFEAGKLSAVERKKLPADAVAIAQCLALSLPADGRLLWQLAELANAHGDVKTAATIMDGCVNEFGLHDPVLRQHRQATRAAADVLACNAFKGGTKAKMEHDVGHAGGIKPRSKRPLLVKLDKTALPAIKRDAVNLLPWAVVAETTLDRHFKPRFPEYLEELKDKQIALSGYIQPLGGDVDLSSFLLIENPVGCWYCEMPDVTGIVLVELSPGKTFPYIRGKVHVRGILGLNGSDPENFLYTISKAQVEGTD